MLSIRRTSCIRRLMMTQVFRLVSLKRTCAFGVPGWEENKGRIERSHSKKYTIRSSLLVPSTLSRSALDQVPFRMLSYPIHSIACYLEFFDAEANKLSGGIKANLRLNSIIIARIIYAITVLFSLGSLWSELAWWPFLEGCESWKNVR